MDWKKSLQTFNDSARSSYDNSVNSLLDRMGLEQKRSTMEVILPALGIFGAGMAVGAALGVLFAPKRGEEIRSDLGSQIGQLRERGYESYEQLRSRGATESLGAETQQESTQATPQAE
ncbi:YtxH domain-containing protein [Persicimonas caeni]|nr:YtxH domain-containing protein [Persicimonas caeni]